MMTMQKNMAVVRIYDGICGSICSASPSSLELDVEVTAAAVGSVASASDVVAAVVAAAVELSWWSSPAAGKR